MAVRLAESGTKTVLLAHLSAENNRPELALETVQSALREAGAVIQVVLAPRSSVGEPVLL